MATAKTDLQLDQRAIGELLRAVRRRRIDRKQALLLQRLIGEVTLADADEGLAKTVRYNLGVVGTQVRDVLDRSRGETFDDDALACMPQSVHARVVTRLERVADRLSHDRAKERIAGYSTRTFRCMQDFETCKASATGPTYWCTIAMLVCLARQVGDAFVRRSDT